MESNVQPNILKRLALASVSTFALVSAAQAQQPVHNWTGFYIGLNAGYAWGRSDARTNVDCSTPAFPGGGYFCEPGDPGSSALVMGAGTGSLSGNGFAGGLQVGYNWQNNAFVYGVEIDAGAFNIGASRQGSAVSLVSPPFPATIYITNTADTEWLLTARARAGWAVSDVLLYVTGGLAVTNLETENTYRDVFFGTGPFVAARWGNTETKYGWTIGAGVEWALGRSWSVKAEYLYLDFGSVTAHTRITGAGYNQGISTSADLTAHIARAGVNFRF